MADEPRRLGKVIEDMGKENSPQGFLIRRALKKAKGSKEAANEAADEIDAYTEDLNRKDKP